MDTIKAARELGKAIQNDEIFLKLMELSDENDANTELKELFASFHDIREAGKAEMMKESPSKEKVIDYNAKLSEAYEKLMEQPGMIAYQKAKLEFTKRIDFVHQIIDGSIDGMDPDGIEFEEAQADTPEPEGCTHDCSSCASNCPSKK